MKAFMRWVERYCVRHPRFGVENLMRYLIIGNAAVWLLTLMDRTGTVQFVHYGASLTDVPQDCGAMQKLLEELELLEDTEDFPLQELPDWSTP